MHDETAIRAVLMTMALMLVASGVAVAAKRLRFPYTIALVLIGMAMAGAARTVGPLAFIAEFRLSPDVVMFVLLPVLIFEAAFNLDTRELFKNLTPILTLAVPGVLISTALTALPLHFILGMDPGAALVFGALISATDPVAVVSLFREMGVSKRLGMLVEGESLLNDGTALVVFKIILGVVAAGAFGPGALVAGARDFAYVVSVGLGAGLVMGYVFARCVELVRGDPLVEITLTAVLAHSAFYVSEHALHASGVIGTVAAGLVMGSYGRTKISPEVADHMGAFWEYFAFVCNSFVFLLLGLGMGVGMLIENLWAVAVAMAAVTVARGAAVFGLLQLIGRWGLTERVGPGFQTIIWWGGLRGALAIVMALSIPESFAGREFLLTLTMGVVFMSLVVNGLSIKRFMALLGLDGLSLNERYERAQVGYEALARAEAEMPGAARQKGIAEGALKLWQEEARGRGLALGREIEGLLGRVQADGETALLLKHMLTLERRQYARLFEEGMLGEGNYKAMRASIDRELDCLKEGYELLRPPGGGWRALRMRAVNAMARIAPLEAASRAYKTRLIASDYEMQCARLSVSGAILGELGRLSALKRVSGRAIEEARAHYEALSARAGARRAALARDYPEYALRVETEMLGRLSLCGQRRTIQGLYEEGYVAERAMREMMGEIERELRLMSVRPVEELRFPPGRLVGMVPLLAPLGEEDRLWVAGRLHTRPYLGGEEIIRHGEHGDSLFIVGRGEVEVISPAGGRLAVLGAGDFFGEIALLEPQPRTATVRAMGPCMLLELRRTDLMPLLDGNPGVRATLMRASLSRAGGAGMGPQPL